ncbi:MAG: tetratricopeptide repeat protein, partial [Planctomycetota bacterium]
MPQVGEKAQTPQGKTLRAARVAFTGKLASMTRRQAQEHLRSAGGLPSSTVSRRTSHLVIGMHGWPLADDGSVSTKLKQAERLRVRGGRIKIVSELAFLEMIGLHRRQPDVRKSYPLTQVAEIVGVEPPAIERWEYLGLVRSDQGAYDFQDIVSLQAIAALVNRGVTPQRIQRSLADIASFVPGTDRPLAQLKIVESDSGELLRQVGETLVAPDGQQMIDFTPRPEPASVIASTPATAAAPPPPPPPPERADDLFDRAVWLEEEEQYQQAANAYRRTIALEPDRSEAYFNLGNTLRMQGRTEGAEEVYRLAIALDPSNELGWYNLADVQEEADRYPEAIAS